MGLVQQHHPTGHPIDGYPIAGYLIGGRLVNVAQVFHYIDTVAE